MEKFKLIAMPMEELMHLCIDMKIKLMNHNHSQCLVWSLFFLKTHHIKIVICCKLV
jgi:hypothetical protein